MKRGIVSAIEDEEAREFERQKALEGAKKKKNSVKVKQLREKHDKERHAFRTYIRTLQHDNEIVWTHRLQKNGYLW